MKKRRNPRIEKILSALHKQKGLPLLAFDFDGTLVGFRENPSEVHLSKIQAELLARLARAYPVAIISGRSLTDLKTKTRGLPPLHLAGNHGFEMESRDGKSLDRGTVAWERALRKWIRSLREATRTHPDLRDVVIEDKRYSLSAHFRTAPTPARTEKALQAWAKTLTPEPRVVRGVFVLNLVPARAAHKGGALQKLMRATGSTSALFAGDDTTDEDVFRLGLKTLISVKVGSHPKKTAAKFRLKTRTELTELLRRLVQRAAHDQS